MKILSEQKLKMLAERYGWSIARAEGYVMGETVRKRGEKPLTCWLIGIDDYALGFRASYFERDRSSTYASTSPEPKHQRSG
jgi:hypothetical protein